MLEITDFGTAYIADHLAVEFWVDVYNPDTEETLILTGRYCEVFGEPELVWGVDDSTLHRSHPLFKLVEAERALLHACERTWQHSRFAALDALMWTSTSTCPV